MDERQHHPPTPAPAAIGYAALRHQVAWAELPGRAAVLVTGRDAVKFVDNFTTAAVASRNPGEGTEGVFADARGWVIALATILRRPDGVWIDAAAGLGGPLASHLERYHIREAVEIVDASPKRATFLVAGPQAAAWLADRGRAELPARLLDHGTARLGDVDADVVRIDWCGPDGFLIQATAHDGPRLEAWFTSAGLPRASLAAVDTIRIEEGWPEPTDMPEKTLPQELGRDARAICFTKGCYLGQETVARIDALGHVNRRLMLVATDIVPPVGADVLSAGQVVGRITSSCFSPAISSGVGMALLATKAITAGAVAEVAGAAATCLSPPIRPVMEMASGSRPIDRGGDVQPADVLLETSRFSVVRMPQPCRDGTVRERQVVLHPGSVVVLPLVAEDRVCLIEVLRVAVGQTLLELPAGTLDREESLAAAAARELAEETGYRAGRIERSGEFWVSPGILRERMHLFTARDLAAGEQALEPGEMIRTRVVPWQDAVAMCLDGRIEDAKTIAGILMEEARRRNRAAGA
jgi:folate-binding protein YgfZ